MAAWWRSTTPAGDAMARSGRTECMHVLGCCWLGRRKREGAGEADVLAAV
jgi:hypothetical protein